MITLTKIFRFETAHAIYNYPGSCAHIHGHSYELHVAVKSNELVFEKDETYLSGLGIVMDFKELKTIVQNSVVNLLDHKLLLSKKFIEVNKISDLVDLTIFDFEPTAENLLIYIKREITKQLPKHVQLASLKLWETHDSCAEWLAD